MTQNKTQSGHKNAKIKRDQNRRMRSNENKNTCLHSLKKWLHGEYLSGARRRRPKRETAGLEVCGCGNDAAGGTEEDGEARDAAALEEVGGGADITGVKKGFKRSTVTVQGLPERRSTKVFGPCATTSYGPT